MNKKIELLAPGGDLDSIKAAIAAGADAIYCGLDRFNARNRAENINLKDLNGIVRLAHSHDCEVFLTLNIIVVENEFPAFLHLLNTLVNTSIDGVIVQDLGVFYLLLTYFPRLNIHASTQLTTHNAGQIQFLSRLSATRVNLSRELNLQEIVELAKIGHENNLLTEVFVHGSNCLSFSGICYLSSVKSGTSGNRGRCGQPCRDQYLTTAEGRDYPLNLKDNSAFLDVKELIEAGVDSVKIEGRIKKFHYVYTVVKAWKEQLQTLYRTGQIGTDNRALYTVFNRNFSNAFLQGTLDKDMFIDNPRDNSALHLAELNGGVTDENVGKAKRKLYDRKTEIIHYVTSKIEQLSAEKAPLVITVSGAVGSRLMVFVQTPDTVFTVRSTSNLVHCSTAASILLASGGESKKRRKQGLNYEMILKRMKGLNDTEYFIQSIEVENLSNDLFIPFKELTAIKNSIIYTLNGARETVAPVTLPLKEKKRGVESTPALSVLLSSQDDLYLLDETLAEVYFQLPGSFKGSFSSLVGLFKNNRKLRPWFPSVLIGDDYRAGVEFLEQVQPERIVTNNTGIAYAAWTKGISWIAGPHLNSVNSWSFRCLQTKFNCYGAFVSNELKKQQIKGLRTPENFKLYYSIYHPLVLLTSRQCLFHQVSGCRKNRMDETCLQQCEKTSSITNCQDTTFLVTKNRGNYHCLYSEKNFLNTEIVTDLPDLFSGFLVDLREIKTATKVLLDKTALVRLFQKHLACDPGAALELQEVIRPTTNTQYCKGI